LPRALSGGFFVVPILIAGETPLTLGPAETETEKEKSRGFPAFTFTPLLR